MRNYIKFKGVIISLLFGIVSLQGLWIYNAYEERTTHLNTHIKNAVIHAINDYCILKEKENIPISDTLLQRLTYEELSFLKESPNFKLSLLKREEYSTEKASNILFFNMKCSNTKDYTAIKVTLFDKTYYLLASLVSWIGLSISFIILLAIFTTIYIRNINLQWHIQKMKDEFTSNMTHELKTPISTISVASEILQNKKAYQDIEKVKRYSNIIHEENNRLKQLVDRVLQVALFESGKLDIKLVATDLNLLIKDIVKPLQLLTSKHGGTIILNLDTKKIELLLDRTHFSNIIYNIVENAIKYSNSNPEITITTRQIANKVTIEISDKGIGIDKDKIKHIFKKYYRIKDNTTKQKTGFGLGLFYVNKIINMHNANIRVESKIGEGSNFIITFNTK